MARIIVERNHNLGLAAAREKAEQVAAKLVRDYGVRCEWQGDVLEVRRSGADGRIEVEDDRVRVQLDLGPLLAVMGSSVQAQLERALDKALQA
ncbi:polyhydroxyalkanoic acid system family protein [Stutzerimonas zhaodongensis]|uniref:polyhydroxyalkanoic acid system family protein n=1 Tax=Stutzerimonas TaxID=2901164 RepID=UPI00389009A7